jgi:UDP-N-acetylmuramate dehydrogenase
LEKRSTQPKEPSAGCVFVNPKPLIAGKMIEECNLKGKKIGNAQISEKHANFIVKTGNAKAAEVVALIDLVKSEVKNKFDIDLKEEIVRVGEF